MFLNFCGGRWAGGEVPLSQGREIFDVSRDLTLSQPSLLRSDWGGTVIRVLRNA